MDEYLKADAILEADQLQKLIDSGKLDAELTHHLAGSAETSVSSLSRLSSSINLNEPLFPELIHNVNSHLLRPKRKQKRLNNNKSPTRWTMEEDELLKSVVREHGSRRWKDIAREFSRLNPAARTDIQCLHRYNKCLRPGLLKGPWSPEEDNIIITEVLKYKEERIKWTQIANKLCGRLGKQVRERWINHLDPELKHSPWTVEEDLVLFKLQRINGNKWKTIAQNLKGRSENAVKNRFHSLATLYHLPRREENLDFNRILSPLWLEERRIKKTRKYKPRARSSKRKKRDKLSISAVDEPSMKSNRRNNKHPSPFDNINLDVDEYSYLDFCGEVDSPKLPLLKGNQPHHATTSNGWNNTSTRGKRSKVQDKTIHNIITMTNIPSPFANSGTFDSDIPTMRFSFKNQPKKRVNAGNNLSTSSKSYKNQNLSFGLLEQINSSYVPNTFGLGNCFSVTGNAKDQSITQENAKEPSI